MAYADKPMPAPAPPGDAGAGALGDEEHAAKLEAFARMKAAATDEEGADALADFVKLCMSKYGPGAGLS